MFLHHNCVWQNVFLSLTILLYFLLLLCRNQPYHKYSVLVKVDMLCTSQLHQPIIVFSEISSDSYPNLNQLKSASIFNKNSSIFSLCYLLPKTITSWPILFKTGRFMYLTLILILLQNRVSWI